MARMLVSRSPQCACLAAATLALAFVLALVLQRRGGGRAGQFIRRHARQAAEDRRPDPLRHRARAQSGEASRSRAPWSSISRCASRPREWCSTRSNMTLSRRHRRRGAERGHRARRRRRDRDLTFPQPLAVGPHKLRIGFTAQINKFGRGLFYVDYPTERARSGCSRAISSPPMPAASSRAGTSPPSRRRSRSPSRCRARSSRSPTCRSRARSR